MVCGVWCVVGGGWWVVGGGGEWRWVGGGWVGGVWVVACRVAGMIERPSIRRQLVSALSSETRPTTYESRMPDETQSCGSVLSAPAWGAGQGGSG